jgi:type II secretory pathway pseudopilin PulG
MGGPLLHGGKALGTTCRGAVPTVRRAVMPRLAASVLHGAPRGTTAIEAGLAIALIGVVVVLSWGWQGSVTRRRVHNAAYLLEGDLRLAQQTAVSTSGNGPQAELCLRSNGYDVYTVVYQDPVGRATPVSGAKIKTVNAGQEYANGIQITPDATATYACIADTTRKALVFLASGAPEFPDSNGHTITVTLGGQTRTVTIQPTTGRVTVGP